MSRWHGTEGQSWLTLPAAGLGKWNDFDSVQRWTSMDGSIWGSRVLAANSTVSQCHYESDALLSGGAWESAQTWISRGRRFRSSMVAFTSEFLKALDTGCSGLRLVQTLAS